MKNKCRYKKLLGKDEAQVLRKFLGLLTELEGTFNVDFGKLPCSISLDFSQQTYPNLKEEPCLILQCSFLEKNHQFVKFEYYGLSEKEKRSPNTE